MNISKNEITLQNIVVERKHNYWKIKYEYSAPEKFMQYVANKKKTIFVEFEMDENTEVPKAVLTIPFVGIMLTVAMLLNISIYVEEIDRNFYESLNNIEHFFQSIYHTDKIKLQVSSLKVVDCDYTPENRKSLFFTGGVDATSALISTLSEMPYLINIWGGDVQLEDDDSHYALNKYFSDLCSTFGLKYFFIKTNGREYFDELKLCRLTRKILGRKYYHDWWASIAHILSMTTSIAPFIYANRIKTHYIGSSYEIGEKAFDSNHPELINAIKYSSCVFSIVDKNLDRSEKVKKIIDFEKTNFGKQGKIGPIKLKVCWYRHGGENCCSCEKCYRTIMNIIVNHGDPNMLGFIVNSEVLKKMKNYLLTQKVNKSFWIQIQKKFLSEKEYWKNKKEISWILHIKFNSFKVYFLRLKDFIKAKMLKG